MPTEDLQKLLKWKVTPKVWLGATTGKTGDQQRSIIKRPRKAGMCIQAQRFGSAGSDCQKIYAGSNKRHTNSRKLFLPAFQT